MDKKFDMMLCMDIVLATGNSHKHREFQELFPQSTILVPDDLGIRFHHEETGTSYFENAMGKAQTLHSLTGRIVLADDSGLSVSALDGEPGVYSARYGGEHLSALQRSSHLLSRMEGLTDRKARFVCCLVLLIDPYRFVTIQETVEGEILHEPRGTGGFGYDPVFYVPSLGKSMAELQPGEKHEVSHRGKAARLLNQLYRSIL